MPQTFAPGDEIEPTDAFVVNEFAAYAGTSYPENPTDPATPIIMLDLKGYSQLDLPIPEGGTAPIRTLRLIFEEPAAAGTVKGIINSLRVLDAFRRNQERP